MASLLAQNTKLLETKHGVKTNVGTVASPIASTIGTKNNSMPQTQGNDYLGSVFNSIRNGVGAIPGVIGGVANDWMKHAQTTGKGIAQFAPNVLFGVNTTQKNGRGGGYVPGLANLVAPWAAPVFKMQADANSAGKATFLDNALSTPTAQIADVNRMIDQTGGRMTAQQHQLYNQTLTDTGNNIVDPKQFSLALGDVATTPFAFGKFQGVGKAGSLLSRAEGIMGATREAQPFLPTGGVDVAKTLIKAPFKQTLINQPNVESAINLPGQIASGQYKDAAMNAGMFAAPAGLSAASTGGKAVAKFIGKNIFDTSGVFDVIKLKGDVSINKALTALKTEAKATKDPKMLRQAKQAENKLRILQDVLLQEAGGNHKLAAQNLLRHESSMNRITDIEDLNKALSIMTKAVNPRLAAQKIGKSGAISEDILKKGNITIGRLTHADRSTIANAVRQSEDPVAVIKALRKDGTIKNDILYGQLLDIAKSGEDKALMAKRINEITASKPLLVGDKATDLGNGYFATINKSAGVVKNDVGKTAQLVSGSEAKFGKVGEMLRKAGISPEAVTAEDNKVVFNKFKDEFIKRIDGVGGKTGSSIYKSLNELADAKLGVTDIRQLSKRSIASKLNISVDEAGKILKDAKDSYKVLSVAERGLAGKLMDFNLRVNPVAGPYSRAQSVARYEGNPFFRLQENLETRFGVASMGGKQALPRAKKYDETINKLNKSGIFTSGYGAEGADSFSGSFSGVKAKLSRDQQANIAATIEKFAGGPNNVDSWLRNPKNADLLNDFKTIVQYPDKGFTSSNLAKMMNLVSFPSRYNLKVTQFAVKQFMKQPAMTQVAVIRGLKDFSDFTKSPEGIKWQADNKEAIGLLQYFTPVMPIMSVYDSLTGKNKTLGDFGMVGGLPFGVITRILTGQGVLKDRVPYVDSKTGKVYSDRVPEDLKARAESLLSSIVDTLYTYPGRTAGMQTSKKQLTQSIVDNASFGKLKGGIYNETDRSGDVTPEQEKQIKVLQSLNQGQLPKGQLASGITPYVNTNKPDALPSVAKVPPIYKKAKGKKVKPIAKPIGSFL